MNKNTIAWCVSITLMVIVGLYWLLKDDEYEPGPIPSAIINERPHADSVSKVNSGGAVRSSGDVSYCGRSSSERYDEEDDDEDRREERREAYEAGYEEAQIATDEEVFSGEYGEHHWAIDDDDDYEDGYEDGYED